MPRASKRSRARSRALPGQKPLLGCNFFSAWGPAPSGFFYFAGGQRPSQFFSAAGRGAPGTRGATHMWGPITFPVPSTPTFRYITMSDKRLHRYISTYIPM